MAKKWRMAMETLTFLMTTTFYPSYHLGGDAIHVKHLAEELVKRGHEVHVMHSFDAYTVKRDKLPEKKDQNGVTIHTLKSPHKKLDPLIIYTFGNSPFIQQEFSKIVKEVSPDVVHHHNISLLGYNILKKHKDYTNLYIAHDYWLICQQNNLFKNLKEVCDKKSCLFCALKCKRPPQFWRYFQGFRTSIRDIDLIIAPSKFMKNRLSQELDVKIENIPYFVPEPPEIIKDSKFSNYFLFVGVLEKHKGILGLLEIFKKYHKEINAKLIIVGNGSLKGFIKEFIKSYNLEDKIHVLGWQDHEKLFPLYRDAIAVIVPSVCLENFPFVALESISVGIPVISSNMGGLPEIVGKVDKALIFESWEELRNMIINFDREKYPSAKVKEAFKNNFLTDIYIRKFFEILK